MAKYLIVPDYAHDTWITEQWKEDYKTLIWKRYPSVYDDISTTNNHDEDREPPEVNDG